MKSGNIYRDAVPSEEQASPDTRKGRAYIAVIGIDCYRAWNRLYNAVSDAKGALQLFSTACVPRDDRWTVIPELVLKGELCANPEDEGCDIIIEPIGEHEQQLLLDASKASGQTGKHGAPKLHD